MSEGKVGGREKLKRVKNDSYMFRGEKGLE